jgi:hypothetical protein
MEVLDYETPQPRGPDRLGNLSLLISIWSPVSFLTGVGFAMSLAPVVGVIVLVLSLCVAIAGVVFGVWSLVARGAFWRALVGVSVNGLVLLSVIFMFASV